MADRPYFSIPPRPSRGAGFSIEDHSMNRPLGLLFALAVSALLSACGSDTPAPPNATEDTAARVKATEMPPPPGTKVKKSN